MRIYSPLSIWCMASQWPSARVPVVLVVFLSWTPVHWDWAEIPGHFTQITIQSLDSKQLVVTPVIIYSFAPSSGSQYWIYDGERRVSGPASISELGLSASPVQAALMWGTEKNKIYFFKGGSYWRFNPSTRQVETIYPRRMADWRGIPQEIDAAFQDEFGFAYFLRDRLYWKFDPVQVKVLEGYPRQISHDFFSCAPSSNFFRWTEGCWHPPDCPPISPCLQLSLWKMSFSPTREKSLMHSWPPAMPITWHNGLHKWLEETCDMWLPVFRFQGPPITAWCWK